MDHAWTRHTDVNNSLGLAHTMKSAGHERIVFNRVCKTDKLRTRESAPIASSLSGVFDNASNMAHDVHVDTRARCRCVDRRTQALSAGECDGNRIEKLKL